MDKCKKCSKKFEWKTIIKSTWLNNYSPVICDSCKSVHYLTLLTRFITSFSIVLPMIVMNQFDSKLGFYNILCFILWGAFVIGVSPFYARFYIKDKIVK